MRKKTDHSIDRSNFTSSIWRFGENNSDMAVITQGIGQELSEKIPIAEIKEITVKPILMAQNKS